MKTISSKWRMGWVDQLMVSLILGLTTIVISCGDDSVYADTVVNPTGDGKDTFPLTVTDSSGAQLLIETMPQRVISYSPGATEILFAIDSGDLIIATDRFSDYPSAALQLPKLEYLDPDPEAALALNPDLVLMSGAQRSHLQQFRDLSMTVLLLEEADSLETVFESILLLGTLTGNEPRAESLELSMKTRIRTITDALVDINQGPRVFYELSADLYTVSPNTFIGGMLELLKAQNVASGAESPFPQLSVEAVLEADPEVILLSNAEYGESFETVSTRPGWTNVSAVVNERVYPINPDIVNRPGPRIVDGLEEIAQALYPDIFSPSYE